MGGARVVAFQGGEGQNGRRDRPERGWDQRRPQVLNLIPVLGLKAQHGASQVYITEITGTRDAALRRLVLYLGKGDNCPFP